MVGLKRLKSAKTIFCFSEETTVLHNLPLWNANNKRLFFCTNPHHTICKTKKKGILLWAATPNHRLSSWILRSKSTANPRGHCQPAAGVRLVEFCRPRSAAPFLRKAASMTSSSLTLLKEVKKQSVGKCWKQTSVFCSISTSFLMLAELVPQKMTQDFPDLQVSPLQRTCPQGCFKLRFQIFPQLQNTSNLATLKLPTCQDDGTMCVTQTADATRSDETLQWTPYEPLTVSIAGRLSL